MNPLFVFLHSVFPNMAELYPSWIFAGNSVPCQARIDGLDLGELDGYLKSWVSSERKEARHGLLAGLYISIAVSKLLVNFFTTEEGPGLQLLRSTLPCIRVQTKLDQSDAKSENVPEKRRRRNDVVQANDTKYGFVWKNSHLDNIWCTCLFRHAKARIKSSRVDDAYYCHHFEKMASDRLNFNE